MNAINFLNQHTRDLLNTHNEETGVKALKIRFTSLEACTHALSQVDWDTPDLHTIKAALAYLIGAQLKKDMTKAKPLDNPFKLASLFLAKDDVRDYLTEIYSTGTHIIGSDGSMMIKVNHETEPGYYDKFGVKTDRDQRYPDYDRVLNSINESESVSVSLDGEVFMYTARIKAVKINEHAYLHSTIELLKKLGITAVTVDMQNKGLIYFTGKNFVGVTAALQ